MATKIYSSEIAYLINGTPITISPLKIVHLRDFLDRFENVKLAKNDDEALKELCECAVIAMRQYYPDIKDIDDLEDLVDLPTVYRILDVAAGIKIAQQEIDDLSVKKQATDSGASWDTLDLAKLEAEVFLIGIWKDYSELEHSLSMPELTSTLEAKRELDYSEKKFHAAMQGVDLDEQSNKKNAWEEMKARVFSGGKASGADDVLALQGVNAQKAGFGIGMGLQYERID